ncbi:MAG: universal stress protein [Myxococcota bacterium]
MLGPGELRDVVVAIELAPGADGADPAPTAGSRLALTAAGRLAGVAGARVRVVHVARGDALALEVCERALGVAAAALAADGLEASTDLAIGSARERLAALVGDADLLVLGRNDHRSHAPGALRRVGSVANAALRDARPHVWLASAEADHWPPRHLVAALDDDDDHVLDAALSLAARWRAGLAVVRVLTRTPSLQLAGELDAHRNERRAALRAQVAAAAARVAPGLDAEAIDVRAGYDTPEHGIAAVAEQTVADVCVLGVTPRRGLARWVVGTTAERMLDDVRGAILVVREPVRAAGA